jgi:EAL domain-containing protein (putative c-di-GMP-specific phosphodiesterase class I)
MLGEDGEEIAPMAFIPAAERYNLMASIDHWVIRNAFTEIHKLDDRKIDFFMLNISGQSLGKDDLLDHVIEELERSKLPPKTVCFEITETAAIINFPQALHFITKLQEKGCLFALDDFGSGLSSFGYLKNLPVNFLKIDGTFVRDMLDDPIDRAMVESINAIGHTMNIQTIAEFVESTAIADELRTIGVDYGQGYGLSRPMPLKAVLPARRMANLSRVNS